MKNQKTLNKIKDLISTKLDIKTSDSPKAINLCKNSAVVEDRVINYTYTDQERHMMILDIGAPVSVAGVPWMK